MRILVIENELPLAGHITRALARCGHSLCSPLDRGSGSIAGKQHDLVVLDLATLKGRAFVQQVRQLCATSRVLMLSDHREPGQRILLRPPSTGDYLAKPFSMGELVARVEALGRRTLAGISPRLKVADLCMDVARRAVARAGRTIVLSQREFTLLHVLLSEPGRTFSRTELCERVWSREHLYGSRTVEMFISRLRRKVDAGFTVRLIGTVRASGYVLQDPG